MSFETIFLVAERLDPPECVLHALLGCRKSSSRGERGESGAEGLAGQDKKLRR